MNMTNRLMLTVTICGLLLCGTTAVFAQTTQSPPRTIHTEIAGDVTFSVVQLVTGLDHPWALALLPGGEILITERPGRLLIYTPGVGSGGSGIREVRGLPGISSTGQGGLLDIVLHPDYERTGWIYFTYSARYGFGHGTKLARARLDGDRLTDLEELFRMSGPASGGRHFGSRLAFARDGSLFMTLGERGDRERAQDLGDHAGSVLRFSDDGSIPPDNPFVGQRGARPEIFTFGHRNAQGLAVNPWTGELWLHEHGPRGGDEVNVVVPGANYGWPVISYGAEYASGRPVGEGTIRDGMEQPLIYWVPSIAPSGMTFYTGDVFGPWRGDLFVGALAGEHLRRIDLDGNAVVGQDILLQGIIGRIRDVRTGPDGFIYLITDEDNGVLYRLEPSS